MRKLLILLAPFVLNACSALNADSSFQDVLDSVNQRYDFVQLNSKSFTPQVKALKGPDILKSSADIVANIPRSSKEAPKSYVYLEVSYFENYDEYQTVKYQDKQYLLEVVQPSKSSCSEHCTATQYVRFPFDYTVLQDHNDFTFTIESASQRLNTQFTIASGFMNALAKEGDLQLSLGGSQASPMLMTAPVNANAEQQSKSHEMVEYLYGEANAAERQEFANWAFANRAEVIQPMATQNKLVGMMADWYGKADKTEKASILSWLISQE
ncbi:TPA: VvgS protein [Vibrio cholerae]